ncbi:hypothetical protein KUTeg_003274 [Tegillarca granosa]|uniref:Uncharacterized protein n=1 Tax=Tegillarca granosa TaxID=220873 RepID=A0ABQ9FLN6_TEGGR|nr:hypothetical protein KUTeg_003274 [Tegillarca granosa]
MSYHIMKDTINYGFKTVISQVPDKPQSMPQVKITDFRLDLQTLFIFYDKKILLVQYYILYKNQYQCYRYSKECLSSCLVTEVIHVVAMSWSGRFSDFTGSYNSLRNYNQNSFIYNGHSGSNHGNFNITKIEDANTGISNITLNIQTKASLEKRNIVGIVLSKEAPKSVFSKKNPGTERYLLNFVVRDSPAYFASLTCWGSELFVKDLASNFSVGDIGTFLPFHFSISENHSNVSLFSGPDGEIENYKSLLQVPTKANNDYYTLDDVIANGQNLHGEHINLLAVVKKIGLAKDITTKNGKQTKRCELKLMDETCPSFALILFSFRLAVSISDSSSIAVVFIADVRVSYDDFRKTMTATADSKTIITVNPVETITDVYNIAEIKHLQQELGSQFKPTQYGISYAFITQFDIDTDDKCRQLVFEDKGYMCTNPDCTQGAIYMFDPVLDASMYTTEYSISLSISDHTGSIMPCHLDPSIAEQILGVKLMPHI